jgi:flagellar hook assembly protein FlgD
MRTQVYQKENKLKSYVNQLGEFKIVYDPNYNGNNLVPSEFVLKQNYPNPFNPTTTIQYDLPEDGQLLITIYNILGQQVKTIHDGFQLAGSYTVQWDGRNEAGQPATSGIYFYRIQSGRLVQTRKMMLLH